MSLVEQIQQLQNNAPGTDECFTKLEDALNEYHRLVQEGIMTPRGNNVQNSYRVYTFKSNSNI